MSERLIVFAVMLGICAIGYVGFWSVICFADLTIYNPFAYPIGRFIIGMCVLVSALFAIFAKEGNPYDQ